MSTRRIGIIGGSGLGERLAAQPGAEKLYLDTPFGPPSGPLLAFAWHGADVVFLSRHGPGHIHSPSTVPYRANIFALKQLGVTHIVASGAVGSLREDIKPGELVICDQVIDRTSRRANTFFDDGLAVHVELADPFCEQLRAVLLAAAGQVQTTVHASGTYVVMEGPQFSTRAESRLHRQWGGDVIGMTAMPEARLAREAEICYALVALATDYDCWRPVAGNADRSALLAEILGHLRQASENATALIEAALPKLAAAACRCVCQRALDLAVWSDRSKIRPESVLRLQPLLGRWVEAHGG